MEQLTRFKNLVSLMGHFKSNTECLEYLKKLNWGNSQKPSTCPRCGHTKIYTFKSGKYCKCAGCKQKFNVLTNTVFENTKIPPNKWFAAIWLASSYKRGVSSVQIAKEVGVTQKTGWFTLQRMRTIFTNLAPEQLDGLVCADECYVGGKQKNKHWNKRVRGQQGKGNSEKINVFGVMEVGGWVKTYTVPNIRRSTLIPIIKNILKPKSTIMTDEDNGYNGMPREYYHMRCNHAAYEYVSDSGATTNPIENYWSHIKRTIMGTYFHVSKKHINRYLAEFDFKFNSRRDTDLEKFELIIENCQGRLKYKNLIADA